MLYARGSAPILTANGCMILLANFTQESSALKSSRTSAPPRIPWLSCCCARPPGTCPQSFSRPKCKVLQKDNAAGETDFVFASARANALQRTQRTLQAADLFGARKSVGGGESKTHHPVEAAKWFAPTRLRHAALDALPLKLILQGRSARLHQVSIHRAVDVVWVARQRKRHAGQTNHADGRRSRWLSRSHLCTVKPNTKLWCKYLCASCSATFSTRHYSHSYCLTSKQAAGHDRRGRKSAREAGAKVHPGREPRCSFEFSIAVMAAPPGSQPHENHARMWIFRPPKLRVQVPNRGHPPFMGHFGKYMVSWRQMHGKPFFFFHVFPWTLPIDSSSPSFIVLWKNLAIDSAGRQG